MTMGGFKGEDMVVYTKVKYEDEKRRLAVKPGISLFDLRSRIYELFKLNGDSRQLKIRFTDQDGDVLTMTNDDDVEYVFHDGVRPLCLEISLSKDPTACIRKSLGPCGGSGGNHWNDGTFEGIKAITVTADSTTLFSIQVTYAIGNDITYEAPRHGGAGESGEKICTAFNYPSEVLQKISGYCGIVCDKCTVIKGITFVTNLGTYGPFGVADWIPFELDLTSTKVVGFYGRASEWFLDSIGPHTLS